MSVLATYSFGQALLTVLEIAVVALWIWAGVKVIIDVFRSPDLSNWSRAGWILLIGLLPLLGVVIYMVVRGNEMSIREAGEEVRKEAGEQARKGADGRRGTDSRRGATA